MPYQHHTKLLQKQLLSLTTLGILITAIIVAITVAVPLYLHDKTHHLLNLKTTAENRALAIKEYLGMTDQVAMQLSSRTFARQKLEQYQAGRLNLNELQASTLPIFSDAMNEAPEITAITRLDPEGNTLIEAGQPIPEQLRPIPIDDIDPKHRINAPVKIADETVLLIDTRIYNQQRQHIGTDIVAFKTSFLSELQNDRQGLTHGETTHIGILDNGEINFISFANLQPTQPLSTQLNNSIKTALLQDIPNRTGTSQYTNQAGQEFIIAHTRIGNSPWTLAISVATHDLYVPLRRQILFIALIVFTLACLAAAIINYLLKSLTSKILIRTYELQDQIHKSASELQRSNRALQTLSACGKALVHAENEHELLNEICSIMVGIGGYRLAWIGYTQDDTKKTVLPIAQAGFEDGYLDTIQLSWSEDSKRGRGPTGTAIRTGTPSIIRDVLNDARYESWRDEAHKRGFASTIALPLRQGKNSFGCLSIYAAERDAFDREEVRLLTELSEDLAYGIISLRMRAESEWAEQELIDSEERWRSLTENSPDHILILNSDLRIEFANTAAPGLKTAELIGTAILDFIQNPLKRREVQTKLEKTLNNGIPCSYETDYQTPDGNNICYESRVAPRFVDGKIIGLTLNARDITQRKQDEARIQHLAYHDELTNLPNRRLLMDRLEHNLNIAKRHQSKGALLFLDLDRFKTINDSLGHATGDAILREVAKRLNQNVRAEDSVARLGGDEFMVLLPELNHGPDEASYEAKLVAEKLRKSLSEPYHLNGHHYHTSPSIGIVIFPINNETADDVLKHADTAMYRSKAAGGDAIHFYRPSMQKTADQRLSLEKDLRIALENEQFELHYQPLVDNNNQLIGSEALLRWNHPTQGWISPETFIPVAEESGLILMIGEWVAQQAIKQLKQWRDQRWSQQTGFLAINISARQFHQANFVNDITRILQQQQINPDHLKLELTESLVIEDIVDTVTKMEALRELGVRIAIDDFGTGYSSLAYLKRLPIDQIKIDKSFVLDITEDSNDAAIVETIIAMAGHLSLGIIAEGVETKEILNTLKNKQCLIFQGYYFSRALPAKEFEQYAAEINSLESA